MPAAGPPETARSHRWTRERRDPSMLRLTRSARAGQVRGDPLPMRLAPFTLLTSNYWVDIQVAAEYTGVPADVLVKAITGREVRATASHAERYGDWMVPLADLDQWIGRRPRARFSR
jgi:hypothetical protein